MKILEQNIIQNGFKDLTGHLEYWWQGSLGGGKTNSPLNVLSKYEDISKAYIYSASKILEKKNMSILLIQEKLTR